MQGKGSSAAPSGTNLVTRYKRHFGWCDLRYNWDAPSPVFYTGKSIASAFFHSDRVRGRRVTCDALLSCTPEGFFLKEKNMLIIRFPLPDSCRFETTGFKACVSNLHAFHHLPGCSFSVSDTEQASAADLLMFSSSPCTSGVKGRRRLRDSWTFIQS